MDAQLTATGRIAGTEPEATPRQRLMSLDALRGFDMFWIIGADALVQSLNGMSKTGFTKVLAHQLDHASWAGMRFYDLIFPLFVFMVGAAMVFSLTRLIEAHGRAGALKRVFVRGLLLYLLGIFYNGGLASEWPGIRLMGVLGRIGIAYFCTGLIFCFLWKRPRVMAGIFVAILLGYWALLAFTPIRDIQLDRRALVRLATERGETEAATSFGERGAFRNGSPAWIAVEKMYYATTNYIAGKDARRTNVVVTALETGATTNYVVSKYPPGLNLVNHADFEHLPGKKYDTFYDPEGVLSTIPAVATCLFGVFAGLLLRKSSAADAKKAAQLFGIGVVAAALGWLWNIEFPVNKKLWTSSYVLVAGGYSAMLLGVFYLIIDVWKCQKWAMPFVWIGMNSITIYLCSDVISDFRGIATKFLGGDVKSFFDARVTAGFGEFMIVIGGLLVAFIFARFLYRRKIFIRV